MSSGGGPPLTVFRLRRLRFVPGYDVLRSSLSRSLQLPDPSTPIGGPSPNLSTGGLEAALGVIKAGEGSVWEEEVERVEGEEWVEEELVQDDCEEMDDNTRASPTDRDEDMGDRTSQPLTMDKALEILVRNAIKEFGPIPRDVYAAVFDLPTTKREHTEVAREFNHDQLKTVVESFSNRHELHKSSHRVVAVYPRQTFFRYDVWEINFKSARIAKEVVKEMQSKEAKHIRETYDLLYRIPKSSCMAGWFFESIAHRMLRAFMLQATPMTSNRRCPPVFSTPSVSIPDKSLPYLAPRARISMEVNLTHDLSSVTLDKDRYYVPTAVDNPLFDSFTIDPDQRPVEISIFQITTSSKHGGSSKGYDTIREIRAHVCELLEKAGLKVGIKVAYYLVCPEHGQYEWRMPVGWGKTSKHRGEAFSIRVPRGKSWLFNPNLSP